MVLKIFGDVGEAERDVGDEEEQRDCCGRRELELEARGHPLRQAASANLFSRVRSPPKASGLGERPERRARTSGASEAARDLEDVAFDANGTPQDTRDRRRGVMAVGRRAVDARLLRQ